MEAMTRRVEPGRVISEAFETYRSEAAPLLIGAALVIGVAGIIEGILSVSGSIILGILGAFVGLAAGFLYTGYVVKLVQDIRDGRRDFSVGELFSHATPYLGTLILAGILAGIAIAIGFVLIIVPGLILLTIWAVISPAIVVEDKGVFESFGRSRELVRGHGWQVFGAIVLTFLIIVVVGIIASLIGSAIGDAGLVILRAIGNVITAPVWALVSSILFFDLGGGKGAPTGPAETVATEPAAVEPAPTQPPPPPENPAA